MSILVCIIMLPFILYGAAKRNIYSVKLLLVMCFFQNIFLVLLAPYIDKTGYNLIVLLKEVYVALTILTGISSNKRIQKFDVYCYLCIIILLFCLIVHSRGTLMQILVSVRQLYLPFLFYLFARQIKLSQKEFLEFVKWFIGLGILSCGFGAIELVIGDSFWQMFHYEKYSMLKIGRKDMINGYFNSIAMYTYDLHMIFHKLIKRMSSILVDPVILGQLLSLAMLFLFFVKGLFKHQKVWFCIVAVSVLLTFAKGGIVIAMIAGAVLIKQIYGKRKLGNALLIIGTILFVYAIVLSVESGTSGDDHLSGLLDHVKSFPHHPFGTGIGSEGNLAINMAGLKTEKSGESFVGTVIGQLGIGFLLYVIYVYGLWRQTAKRLTDFNDLLTVNILKTANAATVVLFLTSAINNTAISFTSCFIYIIILGVRIVPDIEMHNSLKIEDLS